MSENDLEIQYFYCLENKAPITTTKALSLGKMLSKALSFVPEKFIELKIASLMFNSYVKNKRKDISIEEINDYLAWKIWHFKLSNINRYIVNPVCRAKAHLVAKNALLELHKSAQRIKKYSLKSEELVNLSDSEEVREELKKHTQLLSEIKEESLKLYEAVLSNHAIAIGEVNQLVRNNFKQLKGDKS